MHANILFQSIYLTIYNICNQPTQVPTNHKLHKNNLKIVHILRNRNRKSNKHRLLKHLDIMS